MATPPMTKFLDAMNRNIGLCDEFIYYVDFEDYKNFPDPFPRTPFSLREAQETVYRYPNPEKPGEDFQWDIHGRLLTPDTPSLPGVAVVMIHGGAANEYEFLFTPDGPEEYLDLTQVDPAQARVGVAQHIASLGVPVLAVSLPGHYSRKPWPPIALRKPEFVIGKIPGDAELKNRLSVYTYRMCVEAIKLLIEKSLPGYGLYIWGHSSGGGFVHLMEQYGLKNRLVGGLGFGSGMTAGMWQEWANAISEKFLDRVNKYRPVADMSRRSPEEYIEKGYLGPEQPWGSMQKWFELENHRRPQFKPLLHDIEHQGFVVLREEVRRKSNLPDEELFIGFRSDLKRLRGKKILYFVGECDRNHWLAGEQKGLKFRHEVYAVRRYAEYADKVRLVVIPHLTHYGHIEAHNERLANMMVAGLKDYFP